MKSFITSIGKANPEFAIAQMQIAEFMAKTGQMNEAERRGLFALYRSSGIQKRYSVLEDYTKEQGKFIFFPNTHNLEPFPGVSQRMKLFREEALPLSLKAIKNCLAKRTSFKKEKITHLITVSCTGMYAPGLDIEIIEALELNTNTQRLAINFMGCYAAFNALKVADNICKSDSEAVVLIVDVELCTIHFQKSKVSDILLSNALFADGAAAVLVESQQGNDFSLSLESFHCDLAMEGKNDMAWQISDFGFEMTLSSYVPKMIKGGIKKLALNLLKKLDLDLSEVEYFAIHPGGRKILEVIEDELGISKENNKFSYEVLSNFGNMSSATVLFVLEAIMDKLSKGDEAKNILSFAFGPGLTLESMLLRVSGVKASTHSKKMAEALQ